MHVATRLFEEGSRSLILVILLASALPLAAATRSSTLVEAKIVYQLDVVDPPSGQGGPPPGRGPEEEVEVEVDIRNLMDGDALLAGQVIDVIVYADSPAGIVKVELFVVGSLVATMEYEVILGTKRYSASWNTTSLELDWYELTAKATDAEGNVAEASISVELVGAVRWSIVVEIDYIEGRAPTDSVLAYITDYYLDRAVSAMIVVNDTVPLNLVVGDSTYDLSQVNDDEFWLVESIYNDEIAYDDQAQDGVDADGVAGRRGILPT